MAAPIAAPIIPPASEAAVYPSCCEDAALGLELPVALSADAEGE